MSDLTSNVASDVALDVQAVVAPSLAELRSRGTVNLKYFFCFPKLPTELRLKIWRLTFPWFQVIEIEQMRSLNFPQHDQAFVYHRYPGTSNPVALFVNQESRSEALRSYELCPRSYQYINFKTDIIFLYAAPAAHYNPLDLEFEKFKSLFAGSLQKIRHLIYSFEFFRDKFHDLTDDLTDLPALEDIGIVVKDDEELPLDPNPPSYPIKKRLVHRSRGMPLGGYPKRITQLEVLSRQKLGKSFVRAIGFLRIIAGDNPNVAARFVGTTPKRVAHCLPPPTMCLGCFGEAVEGYEAYEALDESAREDVKELKEGPMTLGDLVELMVVVKRRRRI